MSCPDVEQIAAFVEGILSEPERSTLAQHLDACDVCLALVKESARRSTGDERARARKVDVLPMGTAVGRYLLLELVGSGGMGDVYAAYDPKLGRRVAVKLMNERAASALSAARFAREAQAVARLSHPNVVAIYDTGEFGDRIYLAMEFVDGQTLSDWLTPRAGSWREIREVFAAAAAGLAAAHEAGLVHRDFKPQNVMIGRDGSVRVMDFGLAADVSEVGLDEAGPAVGELRLRPTLHTLALTRTGVLLGTPLYMAPEQFLRRQADARTDQFSFCVALYEALFGERPFPSSSMSVLAEAVVSGRLQAPTQTRRIPTFLHKLLLRGLSAAPASRFPSMGALLQQLRHDPNRRRRTLAMSAAAGVVLVAGLASGQRFATRGQRMCRSGGDRLASIWELDASGGRREAIHWKFLTNGLGHSEQTWTRVSALLDDYGRRWKEGYTDACEATQVRGDQSPQVMDRRMACLEDARRDLTDVFTTADATALVKGVDAVGALPPIERCADVRSLLAVAQLPTDPSARAHIAELQERLSRVKALKDTGGLSVARRQSGPLVDEASALGFKPLLAEVLETRALVENMSENRAEAAALFERAVWASMAAGRDDIAAESAGCLIPLDGNFLAKGDEVQRWTEIGEALLQRLGAGHDRTASWFYQGRATLWVREGRYDEALADQRQALALKEKVLPPNHPDIAISLTTLTEIENKLGQHASALDAATRAVDIYESAYGHDTPQVAEALNNRGEVLIALHRYAEAERDLRRALGLSMSWAGAENPSTAYELTALGRDLEAEHELPEAKSLLWRALRIREKSEPNPDLVAETRFALARVTWGLGENRSVAKGMAVAARDGYRKVPGHGKEMSEVDAWLAER